MRDLDLGDAVELVILAHAHRDRVLARQGGKVTEERPITMSELCERKGISRTRVYREMQLGRLVPVRFGRHLRFTAEDIQKWEEALPRGYQPRGNQ